MALKSKQASGPRGCYMRAGRWTGYELLFCLDRLQTSNPSMSMYCVSFIFSLTNFITIKLKLFQYFLKLLQHFFFNISSHFRQNITTFWDQYFLINIFFDFFQHFSEILQYFYKMLEKKVSVTGRAPSWRSPWRSTGAQGRGGARGGAPAHKAGSAAGRGRGVRGGPRRRGGARGSRPAANHGGKRCRLGLRRPGRAATGAERVPALEGGCVPQWRRLRRRGRWESGRAGGGRC